MGRVFISRHVIFNEDQLFIWNFLNFLTPPFSNLSILRPIVLLSYLDLLLPLLCQATPLCCRHLGSLLSIHYLTTHLHPPSLRPSSLCPLPQSTISNLLCPCLPNSLARLMCSCSARLLPQSCAPRPIRTTPLAPSPLLHLLQPQPNHPHPASWPKFSVLLLLPWPSQWPCPATSPLSHPQTLITWLLRPRVAYRSPSRFYLLML